jgi:hypothetical protein
VVGSASGEGPTHTGLFVFWSRYNGTQGDPTVAASANHNIARIAAIHGCPPTGSPMNVSSTGSDVGGTAVSMPGATTTRNNSLIMLLLSTADDATGLSAGLTNADLANVLNLSFIQATSGDDGKIFVFSGEKQTAGAYGATTGTLSVADTRAYITIAMSAEISAGASATVTVIGAASATEQDDTGAVAVSVIDGVSLAVVATEEDDSAAIAVLVEVPEVEQPSSGMGPTPFAVHVMVPLSDLAQRLARDGLPDGFSDATLEVAVAWSAEVGHDVFPSDSLFEPALALAVAGNGAFEGFRDAVSRPRKALTLRAEVAVGFDADHAPTVALEAAAASAWVAEWLAKPRLRLVVSGEATVEAVDRLAEVRAAQQRVLLDLLEAEVL